MKIKIIVQTLVAVICSAALGCADPDLRPTVRPVDETPKPIPTPTPTPAPNPIQTSADFVEQTSTLEEANAEGIEIGIRLSKPVELESKIIITISETGAETVVTVPAAVNGAVTLPVLPGASTASFRVSPINNDVITGPGTISFSIALTEGSIVKGTQVSRTLTINDDELAKKISGYESTSSHDAVKHFYEYNSKGQISKVNWETYSPGKRSGTNTYTYDGNDRLTNINKSPGRDVRYLWTNGRIERSEVYQDGVMVQYTNYAYDQKGNVAGAEPYYKQADGSFKRGLFSVFLYFENGNIYKSMTYTDVTGTPEPALVSTKTYDHYIEVNNPFPMVEILPNIASQKNLPTSYRVEESGFTFDYLLEYEYREDGLPVKRTSSAAGDVQTTVYHYY